MARPGISGGVQKADYRGLSCFGLLVQRFPAKIL